MPSRCCESTLSLMVSRLDDLIAAKFLPFFSLCFTMVAVGSVSAIRSIKKKGVKARCYATGPLFRFARYTHDCSSFNRDSRRKVSSELSSYFFPGKILRTLYALVLRFSKITQEAFAGNNFQNRDRHSSGVLLLNIHSIFVQIEENEPQRPFAAG